MNKVTAKKPTVKAPTPKCGYIYVDEWGEYYILGGINEFAAVALIDGGLWDLPHSTKEQAVEGLTFFSRNSQITIG
jgi:hypothetical protein